jgi:hypothetical protein
VSRDSHLPHRRSVAEPLGEVREPGAVGFDDEEDGAPKRLLRSPQIGAPPARRSSRSLKADSRLPARRGPADPSTSSSLRTDGSIRDRAPALAPSPDCSLRTEGATTTALAPPTRADTNAGRATVRGVRVASRQKQAAQRQAGRDCAQPREPRLDGFAQRRRRAPQARALASDETIVPRVAGIEPPWWRFVAEALVRLGRGLAGAFVARESSGYAAWDDSFSREGMRLALAGGRRVGGSASTCSMSPSGGAAPVFLPNQHCELVAGPPTPPRLHRRADRWRLSRRPEGA